MRSLTEIAIAILGPIVGAFAGYAISRICWARQVNDRLIRLEVKLNLVTRHLGIDEEAENHHSG